MELQELQVQVVPQVLQEVMEPRVLQEPQALQVQVVHQELVV